MIKNSSSNKKALHLSYVLFLFYELVVDMISFTAWNYTIITQWSESAKLPLRDRKAHHVSGPDNILLYGSNLC